MHDIDNARLRRVEERLDSVEEQLWKQTIEANRREMRATIARYNRVLVGATVVSLIVTGAFVYLIASAQ